MAKEEKKPYVKPEIIIQRFKAEDDDYSGCVPVSVIYNAKSEHEEK